MTKMNTLFPTVMQAQVINKPKNKRITIISTGLASGKSVALLFKAIQSECRDCTIIHPTHTMARYAFQSAYKLLKSLGFRASFNSMILSSGRLGKKIKFARGDDYQLTLGIARELIMFDSPEHCDIQTVFHQVYRSQEMVFATDNVTGSIKYKEDYDEDGCVIPDRYIVDYKKSHWSTLLLDDTYLSFKSFNKPLLIREQMLRDEVYLVKGNGVEDNPHLSEEDKRFFGGYIRDE